MTLNEISQKLKDTLSPSRYQHSLGVAQTAVLLAEHYQSVFPEQAKLAGLLHDCAKPFSDALGHAPLGAKIARENYGIEDPEILSAIASHTTGRPGMSELEKIIFIADYIEPGRMQAPRLTMLREHAFINLEETILFILEVTFSYLTQIHLYIVPLSQETFNYYLEILNIGKELHK